MCSDSPAAKSRRARQPPLARAVPTGHCFIEAESPSGYLFEQSDGHSGIARSAEASHSRNSARMRRRRRAGVRGGNRQQGSRRSSNMCAPTSDESSGGGGGGGSGGALDVRGNHRVKNYSFITRVWSRHGGGGGGVGPRAGGGIHPLVNFTDVGPFQQSDPLTGIAVRSFVCQIERETFDVSADDEDARTAGSRSDVGRPDPMTSIHFPDGTGRVGSGRSAERPSVGFCPGTEPI